MRTEPDFLPFTLSGAIVMGFLAYRLGRLVRDLLGVRKMPQSSLVQTALFLALTGAFVGLCATLALVWNALVPDRPVGGSDTFAVLSAASLAILAIDIAGRRWARGRARTRQVER